MSADNWKICPRCQKIASDAKQKQLDKAKSGYGKLSPEKYEAALFTARKPIILNETLREDYEFYMKDDGSFSASYSARCDRCGFKYRFNHLERVEI